MMLLALGILMTIGIVWASSQMLLLMQPSCQDQLRSAEKRIAELQNALEALSAAGGRSNDLDEARKTMKALQARVMALTGGVKDSDDSMKMLENAAAAAAKQAKALAEAPVPSTKAPAGKSDCLPKSTSSEDDGYNDEYAGWYDVQGCGRCLDYCRWVGDSGSGGSPEEQQRLGTSWWSCRLAGSSAAFTPAGKYSHWRLKRCSGENAEAPARPKEPFEVLDTEEHTGNPASDEEVAAKQSATIAAAATGEVVTEEQLKSLAAQGAVAVVMIVCKRPKYLQRSMASLLQAPRDPEQFPIIVSQDAHDSEMTQMVKSTLVDPGIAYHMHHEHDPEAPAIAKKFGKAKTNLGYVRIAQHYGFAAGKVFDEFAFKQLIFVEEDMEFAPDFFSYFSTMLPLLQTDKDLFCVSAWNDNGYTSLVSDPHVAFRTEFFPGLGWMLQSEMWDEVRDRWAVAFWDEFMRRPDVRKDRHCIRPDISRTYTFGSAGTSNGQFFKSHLSKIKINKVPIDWATSDVDYLSTTAKWEEWLEGKLRAARRIKLQDIGTLHKGEEVRIEYDDKADYKAIAGTFGLMPDEKEGVRRMAYRGVIPFAWQGGRVYLHTDSWPEGL